MLSLWPTRNFVQTIPLVFALTTWTPSVNCALLSSMHLCEIKVLDDGIFLEPEECMPVENYRPGNSSTLDTDGNCLELWSNADCTGNVLYYISSSSQDAENVSWADFHAKSVKLCDPMRQPAHRVVRVRRGLKENSTEYFFWLNFSKMRGRSEVFLEEIRRGGEHPDWQMIMGGINWQGPRSKLYVKALYKVVGVFTTYCAMDMRWSRYSTKELEHLRQLAKDVVRLREIKSFKFPHTDPQFKVHARIVDIWKNITITLDKAYELKSKFDEREKLAKATPGTELGNTSETSAGSTSRGFESSTKTIAVSAKSTKPTSSASTSKSPKNSKKNSKTDTTSTKPKSPASSSKSYKSYKGFSKTDATSTTSTSPKSTSKLYKSSSKKIPTTSATSTTATSPASTSKSFKSSAKTTTVTSVPKKGPSGDESIVKIVD